MDTWPWSHHKAGWFLRQSMRVWKRNAFFDTDRDELDNHNSPEITVEHNLANDATCTIPRTTWEGSPEIFRQTGGISDGTDTDYCREPEPEANLEQPNPTNSNHRSTNYDQRHNPRPNRSEDYRC